MRQRGDRRVYVIEERWMTPTGIRWRERSEHFKNLRTAQRVLRREYLAPGKYTLRGALREVVDARVVEYERSGQVYV